MFPAYTHTLAHAFSGLCLHMGENNTRSRADEFESAACMRWKLVTPLLDDQQRATKCEVAPQHRDNLGGKNGPMTGAGN